MKKLFTFHDFLVKKYGKALQRLSFDLGLGCPNRKGENSSGCAFCSAKGARARHLPPDMTLEMQAERGKKYLHDRYGFDGPYIAYFQAYTNPYAPLEVLKSLYEKVFTLADFKMVIISTRPDCLPEDVLAYIASLQDRYEVILELGVQSAVDSTLLKINRGHDFACTEEAVKRAAAKGIPCAAHVILGLPGETAEDYQYTAEKLSRLPFSAIKVHNLLVLRETPMAAMLHNGEVKTLNEFEYAEALKNFLSILPEEWIIMRLSAEDDPEKILAPKWWMSKGKFLQTFKESFEKSSNENNCNSFHAVQTQDGSYTFYHPEYKQYFHSVAGAFTESWKKYLLPCDIPRKVANGEKIRILEVGFGLGCNVTALAECVRKDGKNSGGISITSLEIDPKVVDAALYLPEHPAKEILFSLQKDSIYKEKGFEAKIIFTDARKFFRENTEKFDMIFLDGFSPDHNPELWTIDIVKKMREILSPSGMIATYCRAYPFIYALLKNDFQVFETHAYGRRHGGTLAFAGKIPLPRPQSESNENLFIPLSEKDQHIALDSTAGLPYCDPALSSSRQDILQMRKEEVEKKRKEGMPKWYKGK